MPERLAFIHGFTQTSQSWAPIASSFAGTHDVRLLDAPGHGAASEQRLDLVDGAASLAAAGGQATYVGYSMGGRFALHIALAPSRRRRGARARERHARDRGRQRPGAAPRRGRATCRSRSRRAASTRSSTAGCPSRCSPRSPTTRRGSPPASATPRAASPRACASPAPVRRNRCGSASPSSTMSVLLVAGADDPQVRHDRALDAREDPRIRAAHRRARRPRRAPRATRRVHGDLARVPRPLSDATGEV